MKLYTIHAGFAPAIVDIIEAETAAVAIRIYRDRAKIRNVRIKDLPDGAGLYRQATDSMIYTAAPAAADIAAAWTRALNARAAAVDIHALTTGVNTDDDKSPVERQNGDGLNHALAKMQAALAPENLAILASGHVNFSVGNSKTGRGTYSVSLPPVITCKNCKECKHHCYAVRDYNVRPGVQSDYNANYAVLAKNRARYFAEIKNAINAPKCIRFRYHVSGDAIDADYFSRMFDTADETDKVQLAFTKNYSDLETAIAARGGLDGLPETMHIMVSVWKHTPYTNKYSLPECRIEPVNGVDFLETWTAAADAIDAGGTVYICGGSCSDCEHNGVGCWTAKPGDIVVIKQH